MRWVVIPVLVALAGLLVLQGFLLHYALEAKNQAFRRNVQRALAAAVDRLQTEEVAGQVIRQAKTWHFASDAADSFRTFEWFDASGSTRVDEDIDSHRAVVIADAGRWPAMTVLTDTLNLQASRRLKAFVAGDPHRLEVDEVYALATDRGRLVKRILLDLSERDREPLVQRLDGAHLDSVLTASLAEAGIEAPFVHGVMPAGPTSARSADTESVNATAGAEAPPLLLGPAQHAGALAASAYRARLFPQDVIPPFYEVAVHFPRESRIAMAQVMPLMAAVGAFMVVIIGCFAYSIRTILAQRAFAGRMTAFVNNMTHEFKTPISTVALAAEALCRPDVHSDASTSDRYLRMIRDENERMHQQVEKILQMARLERGDFELNLRVLDLRELIADVAGRFALRVEHRGGRLRTDLQARRTLVRADAVHLAGLLHNLLDNAEKYSPEAPDILVATRDREDGVEVAVADRGVGVPPGDRERVFDRYFRCDTGNRHDVKGFGLGLSYVRLMAEAHGGRVRLEGRGHGGTRVVLDLPADERGEPDERGAPADGAPPELAP